MIFAASIITLIYFLFLWFMVYGYFKIPHLSIDRNKNPGFFFSIVIPFKNEEEHLNDLLFSIQQLDYPLSMFEVILVNDASTDTSVKIIDKYKKVLPIKLLQNKIKTKSPKKDALEIGIAKAKYDWIITTDADCIVSPDWLLSYDAAISEHHPTMIIAPVKFKDSNLFLDFFQQIEFIGLQGMTIGSLGIKQAFLSNGANMGFEKHGFYEVGAYQGNKHLPSGDDVFLLEKFYRRYPNQIVFLKNHHAIVQTATQKTWKNLIQQKIRWASKTKEYRSFFPKMLGLSILLMNVTFMLCLVESIFFHHTQCLIFLFSKLIIDFVYLKIINLFYRVKMNYLFYFFSFLLYPIYFIFLTIKSLDGNFEWKGNKY